MSDDAYGNLNAVDYCNPRSLIDRGPKATKASFPLVRYGAGQFQSVPKKILPYRFGNTSGVSPRLRCGTL